MVGWVPDTLIGAEINEWMAKYVPNAPKMTEAESAAGVVNVITGLKLDDANLFHNCNGRKIAWYLNLTRIRWWVYRGIFIEMGFCYIIGTKKFEYNRNVQHHSYININLEKDLFIHNTIFSPVGFCLRSLPSLFLSLSLSSSLW